MKVREFKDEISKGLGSAILFLKNNPGQAHRYDNTILWACCHNTKYDSQCETGRGQYVERQSIFTQQLNKTSK